MCRQLGRRPFATPLILTAMLSPQWIRVQELASPSGGERPSAAVHLRGESRPSALQQAAGASACPRRAAHARLTTSPSRVEHSPARARSPQIAAARPAARPRPSQAAGSRRRAAGCALCAPAHAPTAPSPLRAAAEADAEASASAELAIPKPCRNRVGPCTIGARSSALRRWLSLRRCLIVIAEPEVRSERAHHLLDLPRHRGRTLVRRRPCLSHERSHPESCVHR